MKHFLRVAVVSFAFISLVGCTKEVPIGYIGMVQERSGLTGTVLQPGRHPCFGIGVKMVLIEASENVASEPMEILCNDDLNFKFDLKIRGQIKGTDGKTVKHLLNNKGSACKTLSSGVKVLEYGPLYQTYIKPEARAIARGTVSKYKTTEIRANREVIDKGIKDKLIKALEGTPMVVNMVASSNYDYPDVITTAMEKKRQREIEIDEEKAKQAVALLKAENRQKLAQKMLVVRATEGRAEAAYLKQVAPALSTNYVKLRQIEAMMPMYENVGQGDKVIVGADGVLPMIGK